MISFRIRGVEDLGFLRVIDGVSRLLGHMLGRMLGKVIKTVITEIESAVTEIGEFLANGAAVNQNVRPPTYEWAIKVSSGFVTVNILW